MVSLLVPRNVEDWYKNSTKTNLGVFNQNRMSQWLHFTFNSKKGQQIKFITFSSHTRTSIILCKRSFLEYYIILEHFKTHASYGLIIFYSMTFYEKKILVINHRAQVDSKAFVYYYYYYCFCLSFPLWWLVCYLFVPSEIIQMKVMFCFHFALYAFEIFGWE